MPIKIKKYQKVIFALFITLLVGVITTGTAYALDYDSLDSEVLERLKVRNGGSNMLRSAQFAVLKFLAQIVDAFDEAVDIIMHTSIYSLIGDNFQLDTKPLAAAIASLALVIAAIALATHLDKKKASDTLRSIIISLALIVGLPSFISALEDMRDKGMSSVDSISVTTDTTNSEGLTFGLGDEILSDNIAVFSPAEKDGKLHYYSEVLERYPESIYHLNINGILDNSVWDKEPAGIEAMDGGQIRFSELTTLNMMDLLGLRSDYLLYESTVRENIGRDENEQIYINLYDPSRPYDYIQDGRPHWKGEELTTRQYEAYLIRTISERSDVQNEGLSDAVLSAGTLDDALEQIRDTVIRRLNIQRNAVTHSVTTGYYYRDLITADDYDRMAWHERLSQTVSNFGEPIEYIYAYDMSFCYTLVLLCITAVCLLFAGFKLATMLYDIVFMSIISYVVVATDMQGSGRAKKMIQELINTYAIFIVIALLLKIFLLAMKGVYTNFDNIIVQIMLILGGAKFVIDGPDFIVKLTGSDAGVKSGLSAIMGAKTAVSAVSGAAHTAVSAPGKIIRTAGAASAGAAAIKDTKGFMGKAGAAFGNSPIGQAFKEGANIHNRTNDEYDRGYAAETSGSSAVQPKDGKDGKDGAAGANGKDGRDGRDGKDGIAGASGQDGTDGQSIRGDDGQIGEQGQKGDKGDDSEHSSVKEDNAATASEGETHNNNTAPSGQGFDTFANAEQAYESSISSYAQQEKASEASRDTYRDIAIREEKK